MIQKDLSVVTNEDENNKLVLQYWEKTWILNAVKNYTYVRPTETLEKLINKYKDYTAIIVGSGASLDDNYDKLRRIYAQKQIQSNPNTNPLIFCSNSSLKPLIANGIIPDYVVAVDGKDNIYQDYKNINTFLLKLISNTSVDPRTLSEWDGERYLFNIDQKGSHFLENTLHTMYDKYPQIQNAGCVANSTVIIALMMGCRKIYMAGCDFGFYKDKYRCKQYKIKPFTNQWEEADQPMKIDDNPLFEKSGVKCWEEHIRYNRSLVIISGMKQFNDNWKIDGFEIVDCSKGIVDEFRKGDLKELIK